MKLILLSSIFLTISCLASPAAIRDDFNDSTINPAIWETSLPFGDSQVSEADGYLLLRNRGGLIPSATFDMGIEIKGSFTLSHTLDVFKIYIRSDLSETTGADSRYHEKLGVGFVFWADGRAAHLAHSGGITMGHVDGAINPLNVATTFRITDDGYRIRLFLNDSDTPIITGATTYRLGNRAIFYNRESVGSSFTTRIDYLEISDACSADSHSGTGPNNSTLLKDNFDGPLFCPNVWGIYNVSSGSHVSMTDGRAVLENFGSLETIEPLPEAIDIRGRFRFAGSSSVDHFKVGVRTDISRTSATDYTGVFVGFDKEHNTIGIAEAGGSWLGVKDFNLSLNLDYDFRITDDGKTILVYLNDMVNPLLNVKSTHRTGRKVYLHNREIGGSRVDLDFIEIKSLAAMAIYTAIEVEFETEIGRRYQIQISEDLLNWTDFESLIEGDGNQFRKLYSVKGTTRKLHRVRVTE